MEKMIFDAKNKTTTIVEFDGIRITNQELIEIKSEQKEIEAMQKAEADRIAARQVLLDKLGITADEAKLLLS